MPQITISPQKFNNQDFTHLRDYCLSRGLLFEDDTFPAHVSSIGPNLLSEDKLSRLQWKRPMACGEGPWSHGGNEQERTGTEITAALVKGH
uniref:Calpain catalytic domain-containing protein n=1 Tax=Gopherus evgoodei TaxID=1825980 RepID=A0A8C4Y539_9SAUR